jgi:hypothetical protein
MYEIALLKFIKDNQGLHKVNSNVQCLLSGYIELFTIAIF